MDSRRSSTRIDPVPILGACPHAFGSCAIDEGRLCFSSPGLRPVPEHFSKTV